MKKCRVVFTIFGTHSHVHTLTQTDFLCVCMYMFPSVIGLLVVETLVAVVLVTVWHSGVINCEMTCGWWWRVVHVYAASFQDCCLPMPRNYAPC